MKSTPFASGLTRCEVGGRSKGTKQPEKSNYDKAVSEAADMGAASGTWGSTNPSTLLTDALDYLNELKAGHVTGWVDGGLGVGIETVNYHGYDFVSIFWGDNDANLTVQLDADERMAVEEGLEEVYI